MKLLAKQSVAPAALVFQMAAVLLVLGVPLVLIGCQMLCSTKLWSPGSTPSSGGTSKATSR